jgi:hypothetical protein
MREVVSCPFEIGHVGLGCRQLLAWENTHGRKELAGCPSQEEASLVSPACIKGRSEER